jgi:hypothetical protein
MDEQEKRRRLFRRRQKHGNMPDVAAVVAHKVGSRAGGSVPKRGLGRMAVCRRLAGLR